MENLFFSLLSAILEWSPRLFVFLLEKFPRSGAPGMAFSSVLFLASDKDA